MTAVRFYSFWSINGPLEQARLRAQMDAFREAGLNGVVFHPRFYPDQPPYLSDDYLREVSEAILYARSIGLQFWIYDENGWPSGQANGALFTDRPADVCLRLDLEDKRSELSVCTFREGGLEWSLTPRKVHGIDCLNPQAVRNFLASTHERYRTGLNPEAFEYVQAFFADEPESGMSWEPMFQYGGVPWSETLQAALRERFGENFDENLPLLFFRKSGYREFRIAFWELVTDLMAGGFFAPYKKWCEHWGKRFVAHVKGEEHPLFQVPMVGSCHRIFREMSMPGIDALERLPGNQYFPRQASSVARQFGDGRCMVECFGGSGWGAAPGDLERYLLWLGRQGLTDFVLHLSQYELTSQAIRDWPPSQPLHLSWREAYPEVLRRVRTVLSESRPAPDTLLVAPYRGIMAEYEPWELLQTNIHNAATYPDSPAGKINRKFEHLVERLHAAGVSFDVTDERTLEESGGRESGEIRLGKMRYARLIVAEGAEVDRSFAPDLISTNLVPKRALSQPDIQWQVGLNWTIGELPSNTLRLEVQETDAGSFRASFDSGIHGQTVALRFADKVKDACLNGRPLSLRKEVEGFVARGVLKEINILTFRAVGELRQPFVWVDGRFAARSAAPFESGPNGTIKTAGPFRLAAAISSDPAHLIESGFPFCNESFRGECAVVFPAPAQAFQWVGVQGDAARIWIDDLPERWVWGEDWTFDLSAPLACGPHHIRWELIPSTFNQFGPHHYLHGDWKVISPDQFAGRRNFADPDGSPESTQGPAWHFKPLGFPHSLTALNPR